MNVKELIEKLQQFDENLEVGYASGEYYDDVYCVYSEFLNDYGYVVDPKKTEEKNTKYVLIG